jgi:O6-methylguanine-DNA--protein-cysteine methyltransferase
MLWQNPFGTTISYAAFAAVAGRPKAARAAGTTCVTNTSG